MKVVILAGGYGTRISEESAVRPKPMVEIGGMPIIWHIMKIYSAQGLNDFVICLGYKGHMIKDFFANYALRASDVTFDLHANRTTTHSNNVEPWTVTLIDTGDKTMTGGRIKRVREFVGDETFCLTYGDCLAALDVKALVDFHREQEALATLTAVQPPGRFGVIALGEDETKISTFEEKPRGDGALDQRRLLRARAQGAGLHRGRRHSLGAGAARDACARGQPCRLQASGLLAEHGQPARQDRAREPVGFRQSPLEDLVTR